MNDKIKYIVESREENQRIDIFLNKKNTELSRTRIKNLILNGNVKYNGDILTDPSKKLMLRIIYLLQYLSQKNYH